MRRSILSAFAFLAIFICGFVLASAPASAQAQRPLYNVMQFGFDAYGFDEDSEGCGVSRETIKTPIFAEAPAFRFKIADTMQSHALVTSLVETFRTKDRCITHIYTQATYSLIARLPSGEEDIARIELWGTTDFVVSEQDLNIHRASIAGTMRDQIKEFVAEWERQNARRL